jgi:predicted PurR-regulated permease PerM
VQLDKGKLKQTIFIIAIIALGGFLFWFLKGFINAFLGALVFYIITRRPYFYLTEKPKRPWNTLLATVVMIIASFFVLILPITIITLMLSGKVGFIGHHYMDVLNIAQDWSTQIKDYFGVDLLSQDTIGKITTFAANALPKFISTLLTAVIDIIVLYFLLFFMLLNGRRLEATVYDYLPFDTANNSLLLNELNRQTIANTIGIAVLTIIQSLVALIGYWSFGVHHPAFWAVLTGLASAIPAVGTGIVWIPVCIILYASGKHWQTYALAGYCAVLMGAVEHIFRLIVIRKLGDVHPIITFFGVILGLDVFGIVGVIYGPLLISYFILLVRIYRNEYLNVAVKDTSQ